MIYFTGGRYLPASRARIPVDDRGLMLGDGAFETLRMYGGVPFDFEGHFQRLVRSLSLLSISLPLTRLTLGRILKKLAAKNGPALAIRVTVTRGKYKGGIGLSRGARPTVIVTARKPPPLNGPAVSLTVSPFTKVSAAALPVQAKTLNYLNSVLAFNDAAARGHGEAVLLNEAGFLAECAASSLFFVKDDIILTPSLSVGILPGITRARVLKLAKAGGLRVREGEFRPRRLFDANEAFLTNSTREIVPVVRVEGKKLGSGGAGPVTLFLRGLYRKAVGDYVKRAVSRSETRS